MASADDVGSDLAELHRQLTESPLEHERCAAAEALGASGDVRAIAVLLEALRERRYGSTTTAVTRAIARHGQGAIAPLVQFARGSDSATRLHVIRTLRAIGQQSAEALLALLDEERDDSVRYEILSALRAIGGPDMDRRLSERGYGAMQSLGASMATAAWVMVLLGGGFAAASALIFAFGLALGVGEARIGGAPPFVYLEEILVLVSFGFAALVLLVQVAAARHARAWRIAAAVVALVAIWSTALAHPDGWLSATTPLLLVTVPLTLALVLTFGAALAAHSTGRAKARDGEP